MNDQILSQASIESLSRLSTSSQSDGSILSQQSSIDILYDSTNPRKSQGFMQRLSNGFQSVFQRYSKKYKTLSQLQIQILMTITHFNREEILAWHEKFLNDCPNGYMTRKQFIAMYASLCPNGNGELFASHIFRAFDLDRSNTVDFREFLIGLSMTSTTSSLQTKLHWIFHVFDIDGNGLLTRNECLEVIDIIIRFNCSKLDDGQEHPEIERLIRSAKKSMMRIFDNISNTHCNTLTITQFVEGCEKDEFISQLLAPTSMGGNDSKLMKENNETIDIDDQLIM